MIDYKKAYDSYREFQQQEHEKNKKRIEVGIKVNIFLPLVFLIVSFLTSGSKLIFLILWIVSLFGIAGYLMFVEYMDHQMQENLNRFSGEKEDEGIGELIENKRVEEVERIIPEKAGIGRIFLSDFKRMSTNVVAVVVVIGLSVIPCLYAWFNILSNWAPYEPEATKNLSVAVASEDAGKSIEDFEINIGNMVVDNLKANDSINWIFTDSSYEAIEMVESGDVYAALVIDKPFSADMLSFLGGEMKNPTITYYENEKKNAIAPKITGKVKDTLQKEVNKAFVSTLAKYMVQASAYIVESPEYTGDITDSALGKMKDLDGDLTMSIKMIQSFLSLMDASDSMIDATKKMTDELDAMEDTAHTMMDGAGAAADTAESSAKLASDMLVMSFDDISGKLNDLDSTLTILMTSTQRAGDSATDAAADLIIAVDSMQTVFNTAVEPFYHKGKKVSDIDVSGNIDSRVDAVNGYFNNISSDLSKLSKAGTVSTKDVEIILGKIRNSVRDCEDEVQQLKSDYLYVVQPQLNGTMNDVKLSINEVQELLSYSGSGIKELSDVLDSYPDMMSMGRENLKTTKDTIADMQGKLREMIADMEDLEEDDQYKMLLRLLQTDPELISDFISNPVELDQQSIFPIENNGSATAPFYIVLSIWVGALIMVAIIHTAVTDPALVGAYTVQKYFGRYIIFFLIGQLQTVITVFGALYYVGIQCEHKFYFWLACSITSFVFTLFLYSLTFAFEAVGEALAVVLMVVQVAGSGGTFPVEVLPALYQVMYKYMPFAYSMNAVREAIAGMHGNDYWMFLSGHLIYVAASLIIGLLLSHPAKKLLAIVDKSKEQVDLMV
ncbi:MAG: YhgE/Pip domain-containing protein [Lachnospiraceae bacterium]|nr:YhgE/Pip domain-containing protein [Lachnospiraceae bacterium]